MESLEQKAWWEYIDRDLQKLFITSEFLFDFLTNPKVDAEREVEFEDYAFVVFPAAKAYEGFLKKLFRDLGFISESDYMGKHFRIGKSLNPSLPKVARHEGVYEKIVEFCGGSELADELWEAWRVSRNLTFHWFPDQKNAITLSEAAERVAMIINAMDNSFANCKPIYGS
jgi:hypothetical protein